MDYTPPPAVVYHQPAAQQITASIFGPMETSFAYMREPPANATPDERAKYDFTYTWFEQVRPGWEELTTHLRGQPLRILEIGSFEGCSTTWMLDHLMDHPDSTLTAIDTFGGGNMSAPSEYDVSKLEQRFLDNLHKAKILKS